MFSNLRKFGVNHKKIPILHVNVSFSCKIKCTSASVTLLKLVYFYLHQFFLIGNGGETVTRSSRLYQQSEMHFTTLKFPVQYFKDYPFVYSILRSLTPQEVTQVFFGVFIADAFRLHTCDRQLLCCPGHYAVEI